MSRRRRSRSWKLALPFDQIEHLAKIYTGEFVNDGLKLQASSSIWRRGDGSGTGRFVYRSEAGSSLVFTIRGIALPRAD